MVCASGWMRRTARSWLRCLPPRTGGWHLHGGPGTGSPPARRLHRARAGAQRPRTWPAVTWHGAGHTAEQASFSSGTAAWILLGHQRAEQNGKESLTAKVNFYKSFLRRPCGAGALRCSVSCRHLPVTFTGSQQPPSRIRTAGFRCCISASVSATFRLQRLVDL